MYQIVKVQDWIITTADNQPARGFLVTVKDDITGDAFSLETASVDPLVVKPLIEKHLANRAGLGQLTFGQ